MNKRLTGIITMLLAVLMFVSLAPMPAYAEPAEALAVSADSQQLNAKVYTITYVLGGGKNSADNPSQYTKNTATIKLANPTRAGYTFKGWYKDSAYTTKVTEIAKGSTGNKTLYAKWAKKTYTITYVLNGGTNSSSNPIQYTVTTPTITLAAPTRKGFTFCGWYNEPDFLSKKETIKKGSTGNLKLYACWYAHSYTVKFNGNGASSGSMKTISCYCGQSYTLPYNSFIRGGYKFVGWNTKADATGTHYANGASIKNLSTKEGKVVNLYAQWKPVSDTTAPTVNGIALDRNVIMAPGSVFITASAIDDYSEIAAYSVSFYNASANKRLKLNLAFDSASGYWTGHLSINAYAASGTYVLEKVYLEDGSGNAATYYGRGSSSYSTTTKRVPSNVASLSISVNNKSAADTTIPTFYNISLDKTTCKPGKSIFFTASAWDDLSGIKSFDVYFRDPESMARLWVPLAYDQNSGYWTGSLLMYSSTPKVTYIMETVIIEDNAGNTYVAYGKGYADYGMSGRDLPLKLATKSFTVT